MDKVVKPEPKPTHIMCSVCDLPWDSHGTDPDLMTCVRLLKAKLATTTFSRTDRMQTFAQANGA